VKTTHDVAVVGSGFAGSLLALVARRLGRSVVLLERGTHPRFAIGESSSPLANLLLEELARRHDLPRLLPLTAWGPWQRTYPAVAAGLKRGFTFYAHERGKPFAADPDRRDQLLVAASPNDEVADTHWYRPDFDAFLVREAERNGAEYRDRTEARVAARDAAGLTLEVTRAGRTERIRPRLVVDASGPGAFLHRALDLPAASFADLPATSGLYAHFENVQRLDALGVGASEEAPPYPVDDAAVHHVFDGGWIWSLRFNNGLTSAGVAATPALVREIGLEDGAPAWTRLLDRLPTVRAAFAGARATTPYFRRPLPFRTAAAAGPGWAMLPSAAAFVDPLLSTGFPLALLGIERLAAALGEGWEDESFQRRLEEHGARTLFEADTAALLVAALYAAFGDFEVFATLTKLYFAAASYAEAARRLGRPALAGSFLAGDHPVFGPNLRACCRLALARDPGRRAETLESVRRTIEPLDVIGLSDASRRNWYPVRAEDLVAARGKLGASRDEIERVLAAMDGAPSARRLRAPFHPAAEVERDPQKRVEGHRAI